MRLMAEVLILSSIVGSGHADHLLFLLRLYVFGGRRDPETRRTKVRAEGDALVIGGDLIVGGDLNVTVIQLDDGEVVLAPTGAVLIRAVPPAEQGDPR